MNKSSKLFHLNVSTSSIRLTWAGFAKSKSHIPLDFTDGNKWLSYECATFYSISTRSWHRVISCTAPGNVNRSRWVISQNKWKHLCSLVIYRLAHAEREMSLSFCCVSKRLIKVTNHLGLRFNVRPNELTDFDTQGLRAAPLWAVCAVFEDSSSSVKTLFRGITCFNMW